MVLLLPVKQSGPEIRRLYRLKDPVSSRIWELVDGRRTFQEIHRVLCEEFDTEAQQAKRDLLKFLKHLKSIGAVRVATSSAGKQKSSRSMSEQKAESRRVKQVPVEAKVKGPLRFSIGGLGLSLRWEEPRRVNWPHPLYNPFVGEESETIRFQIHFNGCPELTGQKLIFDGEHHWKLYQQLGFLRHPISRTKAPVLIPFDVITVFQGTRIYASREYFIAFTHGIDAYFRP